ncbi:hypothetical protein MsAg5_02730 [Methanosarcinaceae archaeon Ag5]|uniref:Uncharacterized protein n=1 Tax=Methanolapillus africanus TaxID=3028297 RepID=A0AAE4SD66_9EURY|nr:hypothetical protein [Methanosarcinaceae archaeon Ag5]
MAIELELSNMPADLKLKSVLSELQKDTQFFVKDVDQIWFYYSKKPNFSEILWYVTRAVKEKYGPRLLGQMKIEVEYDCHFLEIQIPIAESGIELSDEMIGICEEARRMYGTTASCFFLITQYEKY